MRESIEMPIPCADDKIASDAKKLATILTASPNLRAKLFANPTKTVGKQLPRRKYWDYGIEPHWAIRHPVKFYEIRHSCRAKLAKRVLEEIADGVTKGTLSSSVNTDAVFEEYFEPVARASNRSFNGVFGLSVAAFLAGCVLIGAGVWIAVHPPSSGNSTVLASIYGAAGAISALGSIYALVVRSISNATGEHARLRVVLTGFATELGQLRAWAEKPSAPSAVPGAPPLQPRTLKSVEQVNDAIRMAMDNATKQIPESVTSDQQKDQQEQKPDQQKQNGGSPATPAVNPTA